MSDRIDIQQLSNRAKAKLEAGGWKAGEKRDATEYIRLLEEEGYTAFPIIVEFLEHFGGLYVGYSLIYNTYSFHFDVAEALQNSMPINVEWLSKQFGSELVPIGENGDGMQTLVMDVNGKVVALYRPHNVYIGASPIKALNNLIDPPRSYD